MKNIKWHILLLSVLFSNTAFGQSNATLNVHVDFGISKVSNYPTTDLREDGPSCSFGVGMYYEKQLNNLFSLKVGLKNVHFRNKIWRYNITLYRTYFSFAPPRDSIGLTDYENTLILNNLNMPILLGINIKNFVFRSGIQLQYNLTTSRKSIRIDTVDGEIRRYDSTSKHIGYKNFDLGVAIEVGYFINPRLSINCKLFRGMNNISTRGDNYPFKLRYAHFGIHYMIMDLSKWHIAK